MSLGGRGVLVGGGKRRPRSGCAAALKPKPYQMPPDGVVKFQRGDSADVSLCFGLQPRFVYPRSNKG
jgi:hypothetical protein